MKARDIMTKHVITVSPDTAIEKAGALMVDKRVSGLPVIDGKGALVGIVTEGDLLRRAELGTDKPRSGWYSLIFGAGRAAAEYARSHARKVAEVMTAEVVAVSPETPLAEVVALMEERRIKRVPVIRRGKLIGVVSRADLVAVLVDKLTQARAALDDDEIRRAMLAEIDRQPWGPRQSVDVAVKDGVVELNGAIFEERARAALVVAAENLPGVKAVRDNLVWVEPNSGTVVPAEP